MKSLLKLPALAVEELSVYAQVKYIHATDIPALWVDVNKTQISKLPPLLQAGFAF